MYQLIRFTSADGISIEESLSQSMLREKMKKEYEGILQKFHSKSETLITDWSEDNASIYRRYDIFSWKIHEAICKVSVHGGYLIALEIPDPDYPGIDVAFSLDEDGIIPLGMFEQNEGILKYAVYSRMYQEEPQYNDVFDYDVSAIKNICYSAYKRKKTGTYEQGLSYSDFCQKIFTDKHLMEKILSDKEKEMYKNFIKEESGY